MRESLCLAVTAMLLLGCDKPRPTPSSSSVSAPLPAPPLASAAPPASAVSQARSASASASATAAASVQAAPSCPDGARKDDAARYCITLPKKVLAISYEGDKPSAGIREELEVAGDRLVLAVERAPSGKTVAQLKAEAIKRIGTSLAESGDLPSGYWTDLKDKAGQHIVEGVVVGKYQITCTHWVKDEKNLGAARAVCQSLTTF